MLDTVHGGNLVGQNLRRGDPSTLSLPPLVAASPDGDSEHEDTDSFPLDVLNYFAAVTSAALRTLHRMKVIVQCIGRLCSIKPVGNIRTLGSAIAA